MDYRPTKKSDFERASKWVPALPMFIFFMGALQQPDYYRGAVMVVGGAAFSFVVWLILRLGARLESDE